MSRTRSLPWFESLTESVYALGEAAREYQHAHRAAVLARQNVDLQRRQIHNGRIGLHGHTNAFGGIYTRGPHEQALFDLADIYGKAEHVAHRAYEDAALQYASGAVWAIRSVQGGKSPALVEFETDSDGMAIHHRLDVTDLDRYVDSAKIAAHHQGLTVRLQASDYAGDLAGRDYVSEQEAGEMFECSSVAEGIADAAYEYGLLVERAVHFVLLDAKHTHARQLAAERAGMAEPPTS